MLKQYFIECNSIEYINDNFQKINLNRPYYVFRVMTNIKGFNPNLLSVDKISYKNTDAVVYNIKYIMMERENPLCIIFNDVDACLIEESNENKYLIFDLTKNNKKVLGNYRKLWNEIKK